MTKLNIGISARGITEIFSGPTEFMRGFIQGLLDLESEHNFHIYYNSADALGLFPKAHEYNLPVKSRLVWDHLLVPSAMLSHKIDVGLFLKGTLPIVLPCPSVVVIHDLAYYYPSLNAYRALNTVYMKMAMRISAKRAEGIFTVSDSTRQDVIQILNVPAEKTHTIYEACRESYKQLDYQVALRNVQDKYQLKTPFIFYPASSISPRKNFERLLDAYAQVKEVIPHNLYITGVQTWKARESLVRIEKEFSKRVHRLGAIPTSDLISIYNLADFTIYPSLFEGFGIPVLEAFRCGSPVLTTLQTSLPEVAGDAARLVDGYSTEELTESMIELATDNELKSRLRDLGFEQAKKFSWDKTAKKALGWIENKWA